MLRCLSLPCPGSDTAGALGTWRLCFHNCCKFLKDLEGITSDSCEGDVLQLGGVGLCFVSTLPPPSKVDVLVASPDFLSSHADSGQGEFVVFPPGRCYQDKLRSGMSETDQDDFLNTSTQVSAQH
nr:uncharacterized protein LOC102072840 [Zonotrichia albicollis]